MQQTRIEKPKKYAENDSCAKMHENVDFSGNMILIIMFPDNTGKMSIVGTSVTSSFLLCLLRFPYF